MKILVTGGSGYIGSHTIVEILAQGHEVVVLDNLSNSSLSALKSVEILTEVKLIRGLSKMGRYVFIEGDIRDRKLVNKIFSTNSIDAVLHFAGLKAVGESVYEPIRYYDNNIVGSIILFDEMKKANVKKLIFSSSAAVYGLPDTVPITEKFSTGIISNPYARSKLIIEDILKDIYNAESDWKIALLRYFNPAGAHPSGLIGENPNGIPNNLVPYICQVASGQIDKLKIFGNDYPTIDGTGVRDYIHVVDLAKGHISALNFIKNSNSTLEIFNLGTGQGTSVLEVVKAFENASGKKIPYEFVDRRSGDVSECWASTKYAESTLGWKAKYSIKKMCEHSWLWKKNHHKSSTA